MRTLHERQRRVPTQDVDRSVLIGMSAVSTRDALKGRLALAASGVNGTAGRTRLRGESGINTDEHPTALFKLVGQHGLKGVPALGEDRAVEPRLLPYVPPRLFNAPSR